MKTDRGIGERSEKRETFGARRIDFGLLVGMACSSRGMWLLVIAVHLQCATPASPPSRPPAPLLEGTSCGVRSSESSRQLAFLGALGCSALASREPTLQRTSLLWDESCWHTAAACRRVSRPSARAGTPTRQVSALGVSMSFDIPVAATIHWGRGSARSSHHQRLRNRAQQISTTGATFLRTQTSASTRTRGGGGLPPLTVCVPTRLAAFRDPCASSFLRLS